MTQHSIEDLPLLKVLNVLRETIPQQIAQEICSVQPIDPKPFADLEKHLRENEEIRLMIAKTFMVPTTYINNYCVAAYRMGMRNRNDF